MNRAEASLRILKGVAHLDGYPVMFNRSDYPYYRDDARDWEHRLGQLKQMGVKVVTIYIL